MKKTGFTLTELMLSIIILAIALTGVFSIFNASITLTDLAGCSTQMINIAQNQLEMLNNISDFNSLDDFDNTSFSLDSFNFDYINVSDAIGTYKIDSITSDLKRATVAITYKARGAKIIGEDINLNGSLDAEEDTNNDKRLSSPAEATTLIARERQ